MTIVGWSAIVGRIAGKEQPEELESE